MPIFEYQCCGCRHQFEVLVRGSESAVCPQCDFDELEKLLSAPAAHTTRKFASLPVTSSCPPSDAPPCGPGAEIGKRYSYILHTHCGIRSVHFDGRWWVADPILRFNGGHPPPGWDNPKARGKIELIAQDRARFTKRAGLVTDFLARFTGTVGLVAEFRPLPEGEERPPGGLCA